MTRYGFVFNLDTCCDLRGCMMACKRGRATPFGVEFTETMTSTTGIFPHPNTYFVPMRCQHCGDPECVKACKKDVLYKRQDGIVAMRDTSLCESCDGKACVDACVYDSIGLDPVTGRIGKCDMCAERIDAGQEPLCAHACLSNSIFFGDFDDPSSTVAQAVSAWGEGGYVRKLLPENDPAVCYLMSKHVWKGMESLRSGAWHEPAATAE